MSESIYKPTKELEAMAIDWGRTSGGWCNFAEQAGIDKETAEKYYGKFWRQGKHDVIVETTKRREKVIKRMEDCADALEDGQEKASIYNSVAQRDEAYLSKRSPEWSSKQTIEQTNINVEPPANDFSKLSEEDKDTFRDLLLKSKRDK